MNEGAKYIADYYGKENQLMILMEECAELIQACSKQLRDKNRSINNLIEEMGDVSLMIQQISYLYRVENMVNDEIEYKINRQLERIGNARSNSNKG